MPIVTNGASGAPVANMKPEAASGSAQASQRTEAVGVEIPVVIHASRQSAAARGVAKPLPQVHEETRTVIVFPQGAVVRLTAVVSTGELVVLTNRRTGTDVLCRVTSVKAQPGIQSYVGLEFTQRASGFWGDCFPSEYVPPAASAPAPPSVAVPSVPTGGAVASSLLPNAILSQTAHASEVSVQGASISAPPASVSARDMKPTAPAKPDETQVPALTAASEPELPWSRPQGAIVAPAFSMTQDTDSRSAPRLAGAESPGSKKIALIAGVAIVVAAAIGAGVYLIRDRPSAPARQSIRVARAVNDVPVNQPGSAPPENVAPTPSQTSLPPVGQPQSVTATSPAATTASVELQPAAHPAESVAAKPSTASPSKQPPRNDVATAKLSAPVVVRRTLPASSSSEAPPLLPASADAAALGNGLLLGAENGGPAAPPGATATSRVTGGHLQPPKLVSSPSAVYPSTALTQRIQGDVVLDALVNAKGVVVTTKVISGPPILQQAAANAVIGWKYDPARLDGEPIEAHVQVRVAFHLP